MPFDPSAGQRRVAVIGPVNMDLFLRGDAPLDRAALNEWVGPSQVDLLVAGSVGYTVAVLRRLGCAVDLCSSVGSDAFGTHIRAELEGLGVGTRHLRTASGETAIAIYVLLFGGHKRPMTYRLPGFEPWPDPPEVLDGPQPDLVHAGGLLHFPAMWHRGLAGVLRQARRAGARTSLDPQFPLTDLPAPWLPHLEDALRESDVLLCDEREARMIFDVPDARAALPLALRLGPRIVAVKRGANGSIVADGATIVDQPAVPLSADIVIEAVGAGDAFDAGFLAALMDGAAVDEAARHATAAASLTLRGRGGAEAIADRAAVVGAEADVPPSTVMALPA